VHPALITLVLLTAVLASIIPFVYVSIKQSGQARLLQPAPKESHPGPHLLADMYRPWAAHFRFEWVGGYQFRGLDGRFVAAWRHAEQPVFLLVELIKGATHYELLSTFNRDQTLTTTSLNAVVPPTPPNAFVQRFPAASLTELFRLHVAAHDLLLAQGHVRLVPYAVRVDRLIIEVLARTHAFVTALPLWPLRTIAWVLVGPRRALDLSVAEQLESGTLGALPQVSPSQAPATGAGPS
jgi:hypothetical protein